MRITRIWRMFADKKSAVISVIRVIRVLKSKILNHQSKIENQKLSWLIKKQPTRVTVKG
jgi:hypothetical protein